MPADRSANDALPEIRIRSARPEDRAQIERLIREGLLPGYVPYETRPISDLPDALDAGRERLLVAEADGHIVGTLAIVEAKRDVGHLHWMRVDPAWQADLRVAQALAKAASEHARDVGMLKLAVHVPAHAAGRVAAYYHQLGFQFSRRREVGELNILEFYLNLYERPRSRRRSGEKA